MIMNGPEVGVELCTHFDVRATRPEQTEQTSWERHVEAGESLCFHGSWQMFCTNTLAASDHADFRPGLLRGSQDIRTMPCGGLQVCRAEIYGIRKVGSFHMFSLLFVYLSTSFKAFKICHTIYIYIYIFLIHFI